jgi:hypothetical protein
MWLCKLATFSSPYVYMILYSLKYNKWMQALGVRFQASQKVLAEIVGLAMIIGAAE